MIQTARLQAPYRQGSQDLCGIAAYATAVRPFCGLELEHFLHDFWAQDRVTVEPIDERSYREYYQKYAEKKFDEFRGDGQGSKMFLWLTTLDGVAFSLANKSCRFEVLPRSQLARLETHLRETPAIACVSTAFGLNGKMVSHVVNVWFDGLYFCLRDSARSGQELCDGTATTLIQAVELTGIRHGINGEILHGMAVTSR